MLWDTLLRKTNYKVSCYFNSGGKSMEPGRVGNVQEGFWEEEALGE